MDRPRLLVDFNELVESNLVLLSQTDSRKDSSGTEIHFHEGLRVYLYDEDFDENGNADNLIANGTVEQNRSNEAWTRAAKWCCRIDGNGIRHESDERS